MKYRWTITLTFHFCMCWLLVCRDGTIIYRGKKFEFKKANRRLQGIETGDDDLVMGLVPKEQRTIGTKPSKFLDSWAPLCFESGREACKSSECGWNDSRRASNRGDCSRSPWGKDCFERAQDLPSFLLHFWTIQVFLCNIERQLVWFVPFDFSQKIYCSDSIFAFIRTVVTAASWGVPGAILLSDWLGLQDKRW